MQGTQKSSKHSFIKSVYQYAGFLKGVEASKNTIASAQYDLQTFTSYLLKNGFNADELSLHDLPPDLVTAYGDHLKAQGLKANTRRRALATLRRFFTYHQKRMKLTTDYIVLVEHAPKLERVPETIALSNVRTKISAFTPGSITEERDMLIFELLVSEGLNISEICALTWSDLKGPILKIKGRHERMIRLSEPLSERLKAYQDRIISLRVDATQTDPTANKAAQQGESNSTDILSTAPTASGWVFFRVTSEGSAKRPLSERACEHSVTKAQTLLGLEEIKPPRVFRHSVVLQWFKDGMTADQIQERLGLRTKYAFRVFEPLLRQVAETSS